MKTKTAFSIIELLTVMSIIIILLGILVPAMNAVRRHAKTVGQKAQFLRIAEGLQLFESDHDEYPDSAWDDIDDKAYCGAMKLCEAMVGQDGLGFHLDSKLTADDGSGESELYPEPAPSTPYPDWYISNLRSRKEYLEQARNIETCSLEDLYTSTSPFSDPNDIAMLCDIFGVVKSRTSGRRVGMPILYYRADNTKILHDVSESQQSIYDYTDNHKLLELGLPWEPLTKPPLYKPADGDEGELFYENTKDTGALPIVRPHNKESYILISAGWDGIYGTRDDVYNFD